MKGNQNKKRVKTGVTKKTKIRRYNIFITTLSIVFIGGTMVWIGYSIFKDAKENIVGINDYQKSLPALGDTIVHQNVCMASNVYLGYPQIEVPSDEKKYFGCGEHCVRQLGIDSVRYAIDPVNHRKVDKALSILTLHPDKTGKIIYFESNETFTKFRQSLKKFSK